jgi:hypothetical protein
MLCGGIQAQQETTEFAAGYVAAHHAEINSALNVSNASYAVVGEAVQVAGGVVHFLHINGSDGKAYTITVLERPHPHGSVVIEAGEGHLELKHNYGHILHHAHPNHPQHQPL